jgi:transcriptional regulator with XRE-family HTH domain
LALTQQELAERIGVQLVTFSRIELGKHSTKAQTRRKLADALGLSPVDLLGPPPVFEAMAADRRPKE